MAKANPPMSTQELIARLKLLPANTKVVVDGCSISNIVPQSSHPRGPRVLLQKGPVLT